jgi:hypothetical protein
VSLLHCRVQTSEIGISAVILPKRKRGSCSRMAKTIHCLASFSIRTGWIAATGSSAMGGPKRCSPSFGESHTIYQKDWRATTSRRRSDTIPQAHRPNSIIGS